jgi:cytochrome c oxidase cbb3-type subunit 3
MLTQARVVARGKRRHRCAWLLLMFLGLCAGCDFPGQQSAQFRPVPADQVLNFDALYAMNCSGCHGADGRLGPAPPLNDPIFLSIIPDNVLYGLIQDGRHGTLMPAFAEDKGGTLTEAQVHALADGLKSRWRPAKTKAGDLPPYASAGKTKNENPNASAVYARACAECHGTNGEGSSAGAIADPAFLALLSDQALRRLIITGRADLGMPSYSQTDGRDDNFRPLTSAEIDDLVTYVRSLGKPAPATASRDRIPGPGFRAPIAATTNDTTN